MDKPFRTAGNFMRLITKGNEEKYFTHDLKQEHTKVDKETGEMIVIPSREDSYERLLETVCRGCRRGRGCGSSGSYAGETE